MASKKVRVALIAGGRYDRLNDRISMFEHISGIPVEIAFRGAQAELNAELASNSAAQYDLVSTHSSYVASQRYLLAPLNSVIVDRLEVGDFFPSLLDLATIDGALYGIPRDIDLPLLHYRTDLIADPPDTWEELALTARRVTDKPEHYGFVFTGMGSGLAGLFLQLVETTGPSLHPESLGARINCASSRWALSLLRELYRTESVPRELVDWQYDEVHRFFRDGHAAMVTDWPGFYSSYRDPGSAVQDRFRVARMPAGPTGRTCCFAGSNLFGLTRQGVQKDEARELLGFLTSPEVQAMEAAQGAVPVRRSLMRAQQSSVTGADAERLILLTAAIETELIIPPKLSSYPQIEEILWRSVRAAMCGEKSIDDAISEIEARVSACSICVA